MTSYQITQDYSPTDYDHAMIIAAGASLMEAVQAAEMNGYLMLSSTIAQPHIPSYDEYKAGDARIKELMSDSDKALKGRLEDPSIPKADRDRLALDGLACTTMGMLADLSFKLQFSPSVKLYSQLVVAETYGFDVLKSWTFTDPDVASIYNDAKALYDEFRPKAGHCQQLMDDVRDAPDSTRDILTLMQITTDKMRERFG